MLAAYDGGAGAGAGAPWAVGFAAGVDAMRKYGGASAGDRTMLDALLPAVAALAAGGALADAAARAADGADATQAMVAMAGRSNYVPAEKLATVPDPGAKAVAIAMQAVAGAMSG